MASGKQIKINVY